MDYEALFPSRFLRASDLGGRDVTLTIASITTEKIDKVKAIVGFDDAKKELVLNRTNAEAVRAMFGRETKNWIGKRVTFYGTEVDAFGETKPAIRVRGSPDITKPIDDTITRGSGSKTKTIRVHVVPTGRGNGAPKNGKVSTAGAGSDAPPTASAPPSSEVDLTDAEGDPRPDGDRLEDLQATIGEVLKNLGRSEAQITKTLKEKAAAIPAAEALLAAARKKLAEEQAKTAAASDF